MSKPRSLSEIADRLTQQRLQKYLPQKEPAPIVESAEGAEEISAEDAALLLGSLDTKSN